VKKKAVAGLKYLLSACEVEGKDGSEDKCLEDGCTPWKLCMN
jgi:hypothetical protein